MKTTFKENRYFLKEKQWKNIYYVTIVQLKKYSVKKYSLSAATVTKQYYYNNIIYNLNHECYHKSCHDLNNPLLDILFSTSTLLCNDDHLIG